MKYCDYDDVDRYDYNPLTDKFDVNPDGYWVCCHDFDNIKADYDRLKADYEKAMANRTVLFN